MRVQRSLRRSSWLLWERESGRVCEVARGVVHVNRGNIEIVAITHSVAGSSKIVDESRESHMVWVRVKVGVARRPGGPRCTHDMHGEHHGRAQT